MKKTVKESIKFNVGAYNRVKALDTADRNGTEATWENKVSFDGHDLRFEKKLILPSGDVTKFKPNYMRFNTLEECDQFLKGLLFGAIGN